MNRLLCLLLLIHVLAANGRDFRFDKLEDELPDIGHYQHLRRLEIDSLRRMAHSLRPSEHSLRASQKLALRYLDSDMDSAYFAELHAFSTAQELGLDSLAHILRMRTISLMPSAGLVHEGVDELEAIDVSTLDSAGSKEYYISKAFLNIKVAQNYPESDFRTQRYNAAVAAIDSLSNFVESATPFNDFFEAERSYMIGDFSVAAARYWSILDSLENYPFLHNHACEMIERIYADNPANENKYYEVLERRAVNGLRHGVPDAAALAKIGGILYDRGDKKNAYKLFATVLNHGAPSARARGEHKLSHYMGVYAEASRDHESSTKRVMWAMAALLIAGVFCVLYLLRDKMKSRKMMERMNSDYQAECQAGDESARSMLALAISVWNQFSDFIVLAERKLAANQAKDLYDRIASGKILQGSTERFLSDFDKAFMAAYPDFFEQLNGLLREDARMNVSSDRPLSPEQRIAALLRMGITEASQLSGMLRLSVNTVYTYRNRLKGRAVNRDEFEENLCKLG